MALKLISPVSDVFRKDYEIDTSFLSADPTNTDSTYLNLDQGIWVKIAGGKAYHVHTSNGGTAGAAVNPHSTGNAAATQMYQVWSEKGDYGMQALGKVTLLQLGSYEAKTDKYTLTSDGGAAIAEGSLLTVDQKGLLVAADAASEMIVGQCTAVDSTAGEITFIRFASPYPMN